MRIGKLNLTWWRKRPRVYLVDPTPVIDMSDWLLDLDLDETPLMRLMKAMETIKRSTFPDRHGFVGDFVRDPVSGHTGRIIERRLSKPDDWFSDAREIVVEWDEPLRRPHSDKIEWTEDELLPRVCAAA